MMPKPENKTQPEVIRKAALAFFKDKKVLMARDHNNDEAFYTPGGKIEDGETDLECVQREVKEEIDVDLDMDSVALLGEFEAPAHRKPNVRVNIRLFTGKIKGQPKPHDEIVELRYFDTTIDSKYLTPILIEEIFPWLKNHGYIN
jgi:8-oxo-dGTP diphosphatase